MLEKTLGIVLHQIKFGESSLIVHLYTRRWGRLGLLVPGARGSSKNRKTHLLQPLTLLELEVYHKPNRELQKIKEARNHSPYVHLVSDPVKSTIALFLADVLYRVLREEESNPEMFDFISFNLQFLDLADQGTSNFHIYFLIRLTKYLGFYPDTPPAGQPAWFSLESGTFTESRPAGGSFLDAGMTELLVQFLQVQAGELHTIGLDRARRMAMLEALLRYYRFHLEGLGEIRSHQVLAALFS